MNDEVLTVSEARAELPGLVARTVESPGAVIFMGARRKRQAALLSAASVVPADIQRHLLTAFAAHEADTALRAGAARGSFTHSGDAVGKTVAWQWRSDRMQFAMWCADYVHALRSSERADPNALITLDDVLHAFRLAMPADFERREYDALCDFARERVPSFLGYQPI